MVSGYDELMDRNWPLFEGVSVGSGFRGVCGSYCRYAIFGLCTRKRGAGLGVAASGGTMALKGLGVISGRRMVNGSGISNQVNGQGMVRDGISAQVSGLSDEQILAMAMMEAA